MTLVQATIDSKALTHNLEVIRSRVGVSPIWGVVKANAYGHGMDQVVTALMHHVQGFAVARIEEALEVRLILEQQAVTLPILILGGVYHAEHYLQAQQNAFQVVVHTHAQLELLEAILSQFSQEQPLQVWCKLNIGMNRLGFDRSQILNVVRQCQSFGASIQIIGAMAHLSTADQPLDPETQRQRQYCIDTFRQIKHVDPTLCVSLSTSADIMTEQALEPFPWEGDSLTWVRPGIALYGASPLKDLFSHALGLKPVMTLTATIVSIHDIQPGEPVGYGATWRANEPTRLFTVAIGYGDGYPRHINNAIASFRGEILHQAGLVAMDFTIFYQSLAEVESYTPSPEIGDAVELWGGTIAVDQVASQSNSIGYERLTQIASRVHRQILTHD